MFFSSRRRHKDRPTVKITRELLEELSLRYPQHEAAKVVGKQCHGLPTLPESLQLQSFEIKISLFPYFSAGCGLTRQVHVDRLDRQPKTIFCWANLDLPLCRFKTACRALGLPNWPYRRRKSVQTLLDNIAGEDEAEEVVKILKAEDEALLKEPSKRLCRNFKRLRQAFYKEKYRERNSKDLPAPPLQDPAEGTDL